MGKWQNCRDDGRYSIYRPGTDNNCYKMQHQILVSTDSRISYVHTVNFGIGTTNKVTMMVMVVVMVLVVIWKMILLSSTIQMLLLLLMMMMKPRLIFLVLT